MFCGVVEGKLGDTSGILISYDLKALHHTWYTLKSIKWIMYKFLHLACYEERLMYTRGPYTSITEELLVNKWEKTGC